MGVSWNADDRLRRQPARAETALLVGVRLGASAQADFHGPLGARNVPRRAEAQPLVGFFHLAAVDDLLLENAELVTDAVAHRRNLERGHRIEEAGRQPAEAAVAQAGLLLLLQQFVQVQAQFRDRLFDFSVNAQIDEVVAQVRAHEEFRGKIGDGARLLPRVGLRGADPAMQQLIAHHVGERHVVVAPGGERGKLALHVEQAVEKFPFQRFLCRNGSFLCDCCPNFSDASFHSFLLVAPGLPQKACAGIDATRRLAEIRDRGESRAGKGFATGCRNGPSNRMHRQRTTPRSNARVRCITAQPRSTGAPDGVRLSCSLNRNPNP